MATGITENDLLEALRLARSEPLSQGDPPGAMTSAELIEALTVSDRTVCKLLRQLKKIGKLEICKVRRLALDDRTIVVPAYRLIGD